MPALRVIMVVFAGMSVNPNLNALAHLDFWVTDVNLKVRSIFIEFLSDFRAFPVRTLIGFFKIIVIGIPTDF